VIQHFEFGKITINGTTYHDIKIINNKVINWQYIEHHTVTKQDIIEMFEDKPEYVVIGIGVDGLVSVNDDVIEFAKEKNIKLIIKNNQEACDEYNRLKKENKKVNAIIHSTC